MAPCRFREHMIRHTNPQLFKCEQCEKSYVSDRGLKLHMTTHTNDQPEKCKYCDKKYAYSSSLFAHVNLFHKDEVLRDLVTENENK